MTETKITQIAFPELYLKTRDAHKLRGFFGDYFKEHSPLLHNHMGNGELRYAYPLVQYKVIEKIPYLIGINQGSELLIALFTKIGHLNINGENININNKRIKNFIVNTGTEDDLHQYQFMTLWMGLNQENYKVYSSLDEKDKSAKLIRVLKGNILSFFKGIGYFEEKKILMTLKLSPKSTLFKNKRMIAFYGGFTSNVLLPDLIGLGKAVSRGFGTIEKLGS